MIRRRELRPPEPDLQEVSLQVRGALQRELYLPESANPAANIQDMADAVASGDPVAVEELLRSVVALKDELTAVGVISPDGTPLVTVGPSGGHTTIRLDPTSTLVTSTLESTTGAKRAGFVTGPRRDMLAVEAPICSAPDPCTPTGGDRHPGPHIPSGGADLRGNRSTASKARYPAKDMAPADSVTRSPADSSKPTAARSPTAANPVRAPPSCSRCLLRVGPRPWIRCSTEPD